MYYSYVMGISNSIDELKTKGFIIEKDGNNFMVSFPKKMALIWETFISEQLQFEYWNEYIADNHVVFLFHLKDGIKRYEVYNFQNEEVLKLCKELCNCRFGSIRKMLEGNRFYKDKTELIKKEGI